MTQTAIREPQAPPFHCVLDGGAAGAQNPAVDPPDTPDPAARPRAASLPRLFTLAGVERLLGAVFCAVVLLNFCSAVARYAGTTLFIGADEVQVYTMIWLIFLGAAVAGRRGLHLRMDLLALRLSPRMARWRRLADAGLTLLVCATMAWLSSSFTGEMFGMAQRSDAAGVPMWLVHAAPVAGFLGLAASAAIDLFAAWRE